MKIAHVESVQSHDVEGTRWAIEKGCREMATPIQTEQQMSIQTHHRLTIGDVWQRAIRILAVVEEEVVVVVSFW
jgi:hypothetical protein